MASAYLLIKAEPGKVKQALSQLTKISGVNEAKAVTGPYDVIALVEGSDITELGKMVVAKIQGISAIKETLTCIVVDL